MNQIEQIRPIGSDWSASMVSSISRCSFFRKMEFFVMSLASTFLVSCSSDGEYSFRSPDDTIRIVMVVVCG